MSLRTIHKDRSIKTADETIAFIEKLYGTKLMPYQKLLVKAIHKINVKNGAEKPHKLKSSNHTQYFLYHE